MVSLASFCRIPRPRTFLFIMSLRTGTEMISLTMLFNKISGFYGLLAILTGFHLNAVQISMYIYSVIALILTAYLMSHIRKQSPFECLALAWFYIFDMIVNAAYTGAFGAMWFKTVSASHATDSIVQKPGSGSVAHGFVLAESLPSIIVIVVLTLIRVYFILVVMAFARQVLRQHIYSHAPAQTFAQVDGIDETPADDPFTPSSPEGQGLKGKVGRVMVSIGRSYWLGGRREADEEWARSLDSRFKTTKTIAHGTLERERRARSGTGPPAPDPKILNIKV